MYAINLEKAQMRRVGKRNTRNVLKIASQCREKALRLLNNVTLARSPISCRSPTPVLIAIRRSEKQNGLVNITLIEEMSTYPTGAENDETLRIAVGRGRKEIQASD